MRYILLLLLLFQPLVSADSGESLRWERLLGHAEKLSERGRYTEAQPIAEHALRAAERFGPDDNRIAVTLNLTGLVHNYLGRHSQAEHDYLRGIRTLEKCACEPLLLSRLLHNLATLYMDWGGREAQAERLCRRALELGVSGLPPYHPDIGALLSNLAASLVARRRFSEASAVYKRALTIFEASPRAHASEIASILTNRAVLSFQQGHLPDAVVDLKSAVAIFEEALGPGHPSLVRPLLNLARIYIALDRVAMAEEPLRHATAIAETALGPVHPTLGEVLTTYGAALRKTGRKKEARKMEVRANGIRLASPTPTADVTIHIADLLSQPAGKASQVRF